VETGFFGRVVAADDVADSEMLSGRRPVVRLLDASVGAGAWHSGSPVIEAAAAIGGPFRKETRRDRR